MKIRYFIIVATLVALVSCETKEEFNFRKCSWGMTMNEVKETESNVEPTQIGEDALMYINSTAWDLPVIVAYRFQENKLVRGFYTFGLVENSSFQIVYEKLHSRYGDCSKMFTNDNSTKYEWETKFTKISLEKTSSKEDEKFDLSVKFDDKNWIVKE